MAIDDNHYRHTLGHMEKNPMHYYKVDFNALEWQSPMPKARFKAFESQGRRLRMVEFSKGFTEPDWCMSGHGSGRQGLPFVLELKLDGSGYERDGKCEGSFLECSINRSHQVKGHCERLLIENSPIFSEGFQDIGARLRLVGGSLL